MFTKNFLKETKNFSVIGETTGGHAALRLTAVFLSLRVHNGFTY